MRLSIGRLAPRVLILLFVLEVALRFVPTRHLAQRGWEAARTYLYGSFFLPDQRYENPRSHGDLSNAGNVPEWREARRDVFTTDRLGYRNPPDLLTAGPPAAVLFGDSFGGGAANADDETLSAMLTRQLGAPVYNAAAHPYTDLDEWLGVTRAIGLERGWVIFQHLPRWELRALSRKRSRSMRIQAKLCNDAPETWAFLRWAWSRPMTVSPLRIWLSRLLRRIENDGILPNRHRREIVHRPLPDGSPMLFLPELPAPASGKADAAADAWRDLFVDRAEQLSKQGLRLLVVLVPEKLTVYGPLLETPTDSTETIYASSLRLEEGLRRSGVAVVNLMPLFRAEAKARLAKGETIYWRDDTHWNTEGVRLAADAVARAMGR